MSNPKRKTRPSATSPPDAVTAYAHAVASGDTVAGPWVRKACARHLQDLKDAPSRGWVWSLDKAERILGFFRDVLRLNGGQFEGAPFVPQPWQAFILGSLFGWVDAAGFRRFRTGYIETGKGNGKSPLLAGIGLFTLVADDESRAEIYAAAPTRYQANILFRDAVAMRDQSPNLARRLIKYGGLSAWTLFYPGKDSFFRTISSDDKQSGPRPHAALCDELHEHPDGTVVDMLHAGFKFRRQPLILEITNSGTDRTSICYQHRDYSERVLDGRTMDDAWFAYVCGLDEGDDWRNEDVWLKANPCLGITIDHRYLREQVRKAEGMPALQAKTRRLNFCAWVDAANPWIDGERWRACEASVNRASLKGKTSYGGLDLSGKNDLTALSLVFPEDGQSTAISFFWTPGEGLRDREDRDRVPYSVWKEQGHLLTTPGRSIDYAFIALQVKKAIEDFGLRELAFDRYRISDFVRELDEIGVSTEIVDFDKEVTGGFDLILRPHGQGFKDMGSAVDLLETAVLNGKLTVEKNPVMSMCSANAVLVMDPAGSRKIDKRVSRGRVDGLTALAMAIRCANCADSSAGEYLYDGRIDFVDFRA